VISGKSSLTKEQRLLEQVSTVQKISHQRAALDTISHAFVERVGTDFVDAATTSIITAALHSVLPGYLIRFTSGTYNGYIVSVTEVTANTFTLGQDLPTAPAPADAFEILRYRPPTLDSNGAVPVSIALSSLMILDFVIYSYMGGL
jgi:hypothetical protein